MSEVPTVISNKLLKIHSHGSFVDVSNKDNNNHNQIIIFTADGIYRGNLKIYESDEVMGNLSNKAKLEEYLKKEDYASIIRLTYLDSIEKSYSSSSQDHLFDNGITITLENVTLNSSALKNEITLPFVDIFVDQIIGISIGEFSTLNS